MKKTFCDRCGAECNGEPLQRFTIFDVNRAIDVCENCYREFFRWLNNKDIFDKTIPETKIESSDGLDKVIDEIRQSTSYKTPDGFIINVNHNDIVKKEKTNEN